MIWWLIAGVIGGVIGVANAILKRLRNTAAKERQRWATEYQVVERQVQQYDQQIQRKLQEAQYTLDFQVLTNLHFESMKIADHAYGLLKDSRIALDAIGDAIVETAKEKNRLIAEKRSIFFNPGRARALEQEISALVDLNHHLIPDKDQIKAQRDNFYHQVKQFNSRTHTLKLAIRDRCGEKGRDWYNRLETRIVINQQNRALAAAGLPLLPMPESTKSPQQAKSAQLVIPKTRGTVKWFDSNKGFGYIIPDDKQQDVYINKKCLVGCSSLNQNDRVEFERMADVKGPWARNAKRI